MKPSRLTLCAAVTLALLLMIAATVSTPARAQMGPMTGPPLDQLTGDDFDKAFLQQMTMHHAMAVMMARPVVANASHPEVQNLAQGIINDQTREITQMRSWAKDWYGVEIADPVAVMNQMMGQGQGMPGTHHPGMSPGMGMPGQGGTPMGQMGDMSMMARLWRLPPQRLETVFMSQMIPHHQGAIDMATLVPDRAAHQELKNLAKVIVESQSAEIDKMNDWLSTWYSLWAVNVNTAEMIQIHLSQSQVEVGLLQERAPRSALTRRRSPRPALTPGGASSRVFQMLVRCIRLNLHHLTYIDIKTFRFILGLPAILPTEGGPMARSGRRSPWWTYSARCRPDGQSWRSVSRRLVLAALLGMTLLTITPSGAIGLVMGGHSNSGTEPLRGVSFQVGQPAPEFSVTRLDGQPLTSADLLAQEKPFILYFFATW